MQGAARALGPLGYHARVLQRKLLNARRLLRQRPASLKCRLGPAQAGLHVGAVACAGAAAGTLWSSATALASTDTKSKQLASSSGPTRELTNGLIILNIALFGLQLLTRDLLTVWGAKINEFIAAGQIYRLFTSNFLHADLLHLAMNCYSLNSIGPFVETISGEQRFLAIYLTSGVIGALASYTLTSSPSLGASACIFGLGAAMGMYYWRHQDLLGARSQEALQRLGGVLLVNMCLGLMVQKIDNWAHMGGLMGGAMAAWLLGPNYERTPTGAVQDNPPLPILTQRKLLGWL